MKSEVIVNQPPSGAAKVFISSTVDDLKEYRDKARAAALWGSGWCWVLPGDGCLRITPSTDNIPSRDVIRKTLKNQALPIAGFGPCAQGQRKFQSRVQVGLRVKA
jgi:hypothetical protein